MTTVWYGIGDFVTGITPGIRAIGHFGNIFFSLATAILSFYWMSVLAKNPDKVRSNRIEDQPK